MADERKLADAIAWLDHMRAIEAAEQSQYSRALIDKSGRDVQTYAQRVAHMDVLLAAARASLVPREPTIAEMVNRFLAWPLPKDFRPDCGISFDGREDDEWNKNKTWPVGTNLFTADQAREMFEHVMQAAPAVPREGDALAACLERMVQRGIDKSWPNSVMIELSSLVYNKLPCILAALRSADASPPLAVAFERIILWALGEIDDFPDWPSTVTISGNPKYWWRKELRKRYEAALAEQGRTTPAKDRDE